MQQVKIPKRVMILPVIDTDNVVQGTPTPAREPSYQNHLDHINQMNEEGSPYGDIVRYVNRHAGDLPERRQKRLTDIVKLWNVNFMRTGLRAV